MAIRFKRSQLSGTADLSASLLSENTGTTARARFTLEQHPAVWVFNACDEGGIKLRRANVGVAKTFRNTPFDSVADHPHWQLQGPLRLDSRNGR